MREMRERERRRPERRVARENSSLSVAGREESEAAIEGHEGCYYLILYLYLILSDLILSYIILYSYILSPPLSEGQSFLCINPEKNTFHLPICFRSGRY